MFELRVNGIRYDRLDVRFAMVDGYPGGALEAAVFDARLGEITLTSDCEIEIQPGPEQPWCRVTAKGLTEMARKTKTIADSC